MNKRILLSKRWIRHNIRATFTIRNLTRHPYASCSSNMAKYNCKWQQTMLRIKDPKKSLPFYQDILGMTLVDKYNFEKVRRRDRTNHDCLKRKRGEVSLRIEREPRTEMVGGYVCVLVHMCDGCDCCLIISDEKLLCDYDPVEFFPLFHGTCSNQHKTAGTRHRRGSQVC